MESIINGIKTRYTQQNIADMSQDDLEAEVMNEMRNNKSFKEVQYEEVPNQEQEIQMVSQNTTKNEEPILTEKYTEEVNEEET